MNPEHPGNPEAEPKPSRRSRARRLVIRLAAVMLAVIVGLLVSGLTIDLGPGLRARAEEAGSRYLERPLHLGRLSARLIPGVFVVEDLVIEGLTPQDRPFLTAKTITVWVPWWSIVTRNLVVESIDMTDWDMVVETYPNGRHNFPRVAPERREPAGPRRFTTTLRSVLASRGQFTYDDHVTPWSTEARDLTVALYRSEVTNDYRGRASFGSSTVDIMDYEPFGARMQARFRVADGKVLLDHMDLTSDGARSVVHGEVDLTRWPEQLYHVRSHIDFATQKEIFFKGEPFEASGEGEFEGTFHLFKGGRELAGTFTSPVAGVNAWRFPNVRGSVRWLADRLEVTDTTSELYGGTARFDYRMAPLGNAATPAVATWDVQYRDVDLARLTDFLDAEGLRLAGRASGRNRLAWPLGKWAAKRGEGEVTIAPPASVPPDAMMTREIPADRLAAELAHEPEPGPFNPYAPLGYLPVTGRLAYELDPAWIRLGSGWVATPKTYVEFAGRTAYGERSTIPFHVTSLDWQESSRVLAGVLTAFGAPTGAIPVGGHGEFQGVMLEAFTRPRIEGSFSGDRMRAWNVVWGRGTAEVVVENTYAVVTNAVVVSDGSEIAADGTFSLGYPRRDGGEEINARVRLRRRPMGDLKRALGVADYDIDGLVSGEYHVYGHYETPLGFGRLLVEEGSAYGETFESATSALRFEGNGVRLDTLQISKGAGTATGAAFVGWDGNYSFNMTGRRIPVESLETMAVRRAPLSGLLHFTASGAGSFDDPRYDVRLQVDDLFAGDEGVGQVSARLSIRGDLLTSDFDAASPRLLVSGSGRLALTPEMEAEMTLRFQDTSLDPYVRFFEPRLSPFTRAIAGGTIRVAGELANVARLLVETRVEQLDLKLFDYTLENDGPIELALDNQTVDIRRLRITGEGTQLQLGGQIRLQEDLVAVEATGEANLGILQGFFRDVRSRGTAALLAQVRGPLDRPQFSGSARLTDGRIRHLSLPHGFEAINGMLSFARDGIRIEEVTARVAGGQVTFGGRIAMDGFLPGELSLTAVGEQMRVRYPEGFRSIIDADLWLRGHAAAPVLGGGVTIHDAVWTRRFDVDPNLFDLGGTRAALPPGPAAEQGLPLRLDIDVTANHTLRVQNNLADIVASADLKLQGTYDRPAVFGRAEIERGSIVFEGNRYVVTRGTIDFLTPPAGSIEPVFDVEAEARVRVPSQLFRVTLGVAGTPRNFSLTLGSDPPLPEMDIIALLFGTAVDVTNAELRALSPQGATEAEEALLRAAGARLITGTLAAPVRRVVEETFRLDTAQIAPTIGTENDPLTPSARLILGKRLSPRAYVTFSRPLGAAARDQIIVLEYDQNDRVGYVLTQTGDRTFAVDFRVRHSF
jgi:translocation and assembly module TamB